MNKQQKTLQTDQSVRARPDTDKHLPLPDSSSLLQTWLTASPGHLDPDQLLQLQRVIGNQAVLRLLSNAAQETQRPSRVQRRMQFTSAQLAGKTAQTGVHKAKDSAQFSTFRKIEALLDEYHQVIDIDLKRQFDLLGEIKRKITDWLAKPSHNKPADSQKRASLTTLSQDANTELMKLSIALNIGAPMDILTTLPATDLQHLNATVGHLISSNMAMAMAEFNQARTALGTAAGLVEAFMKRNYVHLLDPELAKVMNDPKYKKDKKQQAANQTNAMAVMKAAAQAKLDRLQQLEAIHAAAVAELSSGKAKALSKTQADYEILTDQGTGKEYSTLKQEKLQYQSIVSGQAVSDKLNSKDFKKFTQLEMTGLVGYTSQLFGVMNTPLRQDVGKATFGQDTKDLIAATTSGMNKLPQYTGRVYRHGGDFPGYSETHKPGAIVSDSAFLSTAKNQKGCASGAVSHEVLEILQSSTGRDVSKASVFGEGEGEILFAPGTQFMVTQRFDRNPASWGQDHDRSQWSNQGLPMFNEAMTLLETETAHIKSFRRIVFKQQA